MYTPDSKPPFLSFKILEACAYKIERELETHFLVAINQNPQELRLAESLFELLYTFTRAAEITQSMREHQNKRNLQQWLRAPQILYDLVLSENSTLANECYCETFASISSYSKKPEMTEITILIKYYLFSLLSAAILSTPSLGNNRKGLYIKQGMSQCLGIIAELNKNSSCLGGLCKLRSRWIYSVLCGAVLVGIGSIFTIFMSNPCASTSIVGGPFSFVGCFLIVPSLYSAYLQGHSHLSGVISTIPESIISHQPTRQIELSAVGSFPDESTPLLASLPASFSEMSNENECMICYDSNKTPSANICGNTEHAMCQPCLRKLKSSKIGLAQTVRCPFCNRTKT